jgi:hypothetical protein
MGGNNDSIPSHDIIVEKKHFEEVGMDDEWEVMGRLIALGDFVEGADIDSSIQSYVSWFIESMKNMVVLAIIEKRSDQSIDRSVAGRDDEV